MSKLKKFLKNPWAWGILFGIATVHFVRPLMRYEPPPPPITGKLVEYSFTNQENKLFGSENLRGKTYLISWVKLECEGNCPLLMQGLKKIQKLYKRDWLPIELVTICVDCEINKLRDFANSWTDDFTTWNFLLGKIEVNQIYLENNILSASKIAIIDVNGDIHGFYNSDELGLDEVYNRAKHVWKEYQKK